MKISITIPFENADTQAGIWAFEENEIAFGRELERAARCTISYAAVELKNHLEQILLDAQIIICAEEIPGTFVIRLVPDSLIVRGENYSLIPEENGLTIRGEGRVGVLYGVYELLKRQGYRWYEPGPVGAYIPPHCETLCLPTQIETYETPSWVGRGFSLDGHLNESEELAVWMARNRLNIYFARPHTWNLMHKLGFVLREGGHIFETMLHPDRLMPDGRTVWDAHPEWFGTPLNGEKRKEDAHKTQFCVCQPELMEFLGEDLLKHIMHEWHEADEINVWGFDTWGNVCSCEKCRALGNGTDQNLYMVSQLRDYLNRARKDGRLDRDIRMVLCAYEGTSNLFPPENPIPQNLIDADDYCLYATIVRCYAHEFGDPSCSYNREYNQIFLDWNKLSNKMAMTVLEYYNVSKFEDLPLLFTESMKKDFPYYSRSGANGFNYMHIPMVNWGVRALTQMLFAELSWNPFADVDALVEEYFQKRYGEYADRMKTIYAKIEKASALITSWRAWKERSLLSKLMEWDGDIPQVPLQVDDHFETPERFEEIGTETEALLLDALSLLNEVVKEEKQNTEHIQSSVTAAVNPVELRKSQAGAKLIHYLTEDKRGLIYGVDTMQLMLRMGQYYNALYAGDHIRADSLWALIEQAEEKMESYFMPATYSADYLALISKDGLARTQLKEAVARCRKARILRQ